MRVDRGSDPALLPSWRTKLRSKDIARHMSFVGMELDLAMDSSLPANPPYLLRSLSQDLDALLDLGTMKRWARVTFSG